MSNPIPRSDTNSQDYPNPYDFPVLLWEALHPYFDKYRVRFTESNPQEAFEGPTISWEIYNRTPGRADSKTQTRGPSYNRTKEATDDGMLEYENIQFHTVTYRFKVFSSSNTEANKIAWDLENLLPQVTGIVGRQKEIPGLSMVFLRQTSQNEDRTSAVQDDLVVRNLLFLAQVPVFYPRTITSMRTMKMDLYIGRKLTSTGRLKRATDSDKTYITVNPDQAVVGIFAVFKLIGTNQVYDTRLQQGVDYHIERDEHGILYIKWDDTYGNTPLVGEDYRVDYFVSALRTDYKDLERPPSI